MYIVAIAKIADSQYIIAFDKKFVALFYQLDPLVLQWNFVADAIKLTFSISNVNIFVDTKRTFLLIQKCRLIFNLRLFQI